ncbi:MAG: T9SS type A sorting domain-containing protein [Candidatus Cloacimonadota bacterium]|nr:MAG: T9SS type A sorting domain-containing protein [Candidatus Cloacimonadota bacterium]
MSKAIGMHTLSLNCYPVPVSKKVFFSYGVPFTASIDIGLYDVSGRKIAAIEHNSLKTYGVYTGSCKLTDMPLSSGVYFLKVVARSSESILENSRKIIFVR